MGFPSQSLPSLDDPVCIIGLGYVGIPLLLETARKSSSRFVIGFDIDESKIRRLSGEDYILEEFGYDLSIPDLQKTRDLRLTSSLDDLQECRIFIIAVPTPVDKHRVPDLGHLISASKSVNTVLKRKLTKGYSSEISLVIYESTVYPGATESVCYPHLTSNSEEIKNLVRLGYSPERINPGDRKHSLCDVPKITSGQDVETAALVNSFYQQIVTAGTHLTNSIKAAETAKVLENTQRDVNIALANELAVICSRLDIDTNDVIDAACTKWNLRMCVQD